MNQPAEAVSNRSTSVSRSSRRKRKQRKALYQVLFWILLFLSGFFIGLLTGLHQKKDFQFILPSEASEYPVLSQDTVIKKNIQIPENLPWNLTLVNYEYPLSRDFIPQELAEADNTYETDSRIADAVKEMIAAARRENVRIIAISGYRDYDYQLQLFKDKVSQLQQENGYSVTKAREEAATVVAYPGTSEHQLGLALDLVDARHVKLDQSQENTDAYQWLLKHCHEYGFIVRYPSGKTDITGIIYEPWHFRYVGVEAASYIMENGLTLEEYLSEHYKKL